MFDKAERCAAVSIDVDDGSATIEFRGDDPSSIRQHYIRVEGLSPTTCKELSRSLAKAAMELAPKAKKRIKGRPT